MTKVSTQAAHNLMARIPGRVSSNTRIVEGFLNHGVVYLELHGNPIACLKPDGTLLICSARWETATTKSRLNALPNVRIHAKARKWYLNGHEWKDSANWTNVKDFSLAIPCEISVFGQAASVGSFTVSIQ